MPEREELEVIVSTEAQVERREKRQREKTEGFALREAMAAERGGRERGS